MLCFGILLAQTKESENFREQLNMVAVPGKKRMKEGRKKGFSSYYALISVGNLSTTFSTDFFLPLLNLSYISSRARVGIKPEATHRLDSSISMTLVVRIYYIKSRHCLV